MNLKESIVDHINSHINETDDPYRIIDIFYNTAPNNGRLTFCGFKILKNIYPFYEVDIEFSGSISQYSALLKSMKGLYYEHKSKIKGNIKIQTTDRKFVNRLKLTGNNFSVLERSLKTSKKG